jgi:predicted transcriptional regulator
MARDGKRTTRAFNGRLEEGSLDTLQRMADADKRSLTFMVQEAIDEFIARRKGKASRASKTTAPGETAARPF